VVCSIPVRGAALIPLNPRKAKPSRPIPLSASGSFWRGAAEKRGFMSLFATVLLNRVGE
jgi:hypothetical protein